MSKGGADLFKVGKQSDEILGGAGDLTSLSAKIDGLKGLDIDGLKGLDDDFFKGFDADTFKLFDEDTLKTLNKLDVDEMRKLGIDPDDLASASKGGAKATKTSGKLSKFKSWCVKNPKKCGGAAALLTAGATAGGIAIARKKYEEEQEQNRKYCRDICLKYDSKDTAKNSESEQEDWDWNTQPFCTSTVEKSFRNEETFDWKSDNGDGSLSDYMTLEQRKKLNCNDEDSDDEDGSGECCDTYCELDCDSKYYTKNFLGGSDNNDSDFWNSLFGGEMPMGLKIALIVLIIIIVLIILFYLIKFFRNMSQKK